MSSPSILDALSGFTDWQIEVHGSHFETGADDKRVVELCGKNGWALVTLDEMRYTPETTAEISRHNVAVFKVVTHRETHFAVVAAALVKAHKSIVAMTSRNNTGFCAHVYGDGKVVIMNRYGEPSEATESQKRTLRKFGRI